MDQASASHKLQLDAVYEHLRAGEFEQAAAQLTQLEEQPDETDAARIEYLLARSFLHYCKRDAASALKITSEAFELAQRAGQSALAARAKAYAANQFDMLGEPRDSIAAAQWALEHAPADDSPTRIRALISLARAEEAAGDLKRANQLYSASLKHARNNRAIVSSVLLAMATSEVEHARRLWASGTPIESMARQSLESILSSHMLVETSGTAVNRSSSTLFVAEAQMILGDLEAAAASYRTALSTCPAGSVQTPDIACAFSDLALCLSLLAQAEEAVPPIARALDMLDVLHDPESEYVVCANAARVFAALGLNEDSTRYAARAADAERRLAQERAQVKTWLVAAPPVVDAELARQDHLAPGLPESPDQAGN
ncbi:hypothetical protein IP84_14825 [beta proteobacterium AAP99]|nr:hypothetical protein IP84_14825 [beta proteobacterium AAP99]